MQNQLKFHEKAIDIKLTQSAVQQSKKLDSILLIEIQIYFSCLLGKRLAFYSEEKMDGVWQLNAEDFSDVLKSAQKLTNDIYIRFNTVMTKTCPVGDQIGPPPVTDFKVAKQRPYVPNWMNIDYEYNQWSGQYGWNSSEKGSENTKQVRG